MCCIYQTLVFQTLLLFSCAWSTMNGGSFRAVRPKAATQSFRQRRHDRLAVWCQPAFALVADGLGRNRKSTDQRGRGGRVFSRAISSRKSWFSACRVVRSVSACSDWFPNPATCALSARSRCNRSTTSRRRASGASSQFHRRSGAHLPGNRFCRKPYSVIQGAVTSSASGSELTELLKGTQLGPELPLADHVDQLDPGDGRRR